MSRLLFLNLPVADLAASRAFFAALGFEFDEKFCDEGAACMVVSDQAYVMLLQRDRFAEFVTKPIADAQETTALTACVSAANREEVDALADAAAAAGAGEAKGPQDYGFMYQRSFHDLDGPLGDRLDGPGRDREGPGGVPRRVGLTFGTPGMWTFREREDTVRRASREERHGSVRVPGGTSTEMLDVGGRVRGLWRLSCP